MQEQVPYKDDNLAPTPIGEIVGDDQLPNEMRRSRKGRLEMTAIGIMALGALLMFQPLTITLYSYSFLVILAGTLMFIVVSHFPE
jgi:hypothetical protein